MARTMVRDLNGITVGELKAILESIPAETEICVWGANVDAIEIEVNTYDTQPADVYVNVDTLPSW